MVFPSNSSVIRRPPSLHRVLSGEFPGFIGTLQALRRLAVRLGRLRSSLAARYRPQRSVFAAGRRAHAAGGPGVLVDRLPAYRFFVSDGDDEASQVPWQPLFTCPAL